MINPDGVRHQIHGNVIQSTSRALMEEVSFDRNSVTAREWGAYPIIKFPEVPDIRCAGCCRAAGSAAARRRRVRLRPRVPQPSPTPSMMRPACASANCRLTPERILRGLHGGGNTRRCTRCRRQHPRRSPTLNKWQKASSPRRNRRVRNRRSALRGRGRHRRRRAAMARHRADRTSRCIGLFRRDHRPRPATRRARRLRGLPHLCEWHSQRRRPAAADAVRHDLFDQHHARCRNRHRRWSYPAFERAMRDGIHRDGRHLYPAFPIRISPRHSPDADMQALYAYLMAQSPVRAETPAECARIPVQPAPADGGMERAVPQAGTSSSPIRQNPRLGIAAPIWWKGLGHCSACHLPRNALGAEKASAYLAGGFAEGWEAPALTVAVAGADPMERGRALRLSANRRVPLSRRRCRADGARGEGTRRRCRIRTSAPWRSISPRSATHAIDRAAQQALAAKLRGLDRHPNIRGFRHRRPALSGRLRGVPRGRRRAAVRQAARRWRCNGNLHSAVPDNLIQVILHGIAAPAASDLGYMPAFKDSLDRRPGRRTGRLVSGGNLPRISLLWTDIPAAVGRIRQE